MKAPDIFAIFAKAPTPGSVKTRLAAQTDPIFAAQVADAFLRDTIVKAHELDVERFLVYAPQNRKAYFEQLAQRHFEMEAQSAGDLGHRLYSFLRNRFGAQAKRVVVIGSDSPTLPMAFVERAFRELEKADIALGPAPDGGYYLLGCANRTPPIFEGVPWGSAKVFEETIRLAKEAELRITILEPWYDVDTKEDWEKLKEHCLELRAAGMDPGIPATEALF
ncbi:MAG: TIGR04282 family arsenosugar biosynthesis glycosyltransferase [Planctomycetes bacterium]|nr:TIGR04282 family arsenosugar biosynthesis glycosyltransferase [Planctomycetota bacterium]